MDDNAKRTTGQIVGGCGCFLLLISAIWLCFVAYVGYVGRGNDEEASAIAAAVTCCCMLPVVLLTAGGAFFAFRKGADTTEP